MSYMIPSIRDSIHIDPHETSQASVDLVWKFYMVLFELSFNVIWCFSHTRLRMSQDRSCFVNFSTWSIPGQIYGERGIVPETEIEKKMCWLGIF